MKEEEQRKFAQAIADFVRNDFLALTSIGGQLRFGGGPEDIGLNKDTTLRQLLDRAAVKLSQRRDLDPLTEAELNWIVGVNYEMTGEAKLAVPLLRRCVALRKQVLGEGHFETLLAQNSLAVAYGDAGCRDDELAIYEAAFVIGKAKLGAEHFATLAIMDNLASAYQKAGRMDEALTLAEEALRLCAATRGVDHPVTANSMDTLGWGFAKNGQLAKALPLLQEALRIRTTRLGRDHPDTWKSMQSLALCYSLDGRVSEALPILEETLRLRTTRLGPEHPVTVTSMIYLGDNYKAAGRLKEALPLLANAYRARAKIPDIRSAVGGRLLLGYAAAGRTTEAGVLANELLADARIALPEESSQLASALSRYAATLVQGGALEILSLLEEVIRLQKAKLGPDHPETLMSMNALATGYWMAKRLDQSVPLFEETVRLSEQKRGRADPDTLRTVANLGVNYKDAGRLKEAVPLLEEAYRASQKYPTLRLFGEALVDGYIEVGRFAEAKALAKDALLEARKTMPKESAELAASLAGLGSTFLQAKDFNAAEPLLRECLNIREKTQPDAWNTFNAQSMLAGALVGQKRFSEAEPFLRSGYEGMMVRKEPIPWQSSTCLPEALDRLIELYTATNNPDELKKWQAEWAKYDGGTKGSPPEKK
jgi:tetratricopeptide (TPR) repeat protein